MRAFLLLAVALALGCRAQTPERPTVPDPRALAPESTRLSIEDFSQEGAVVYREGPASADGTGRFYLGREIARVMSHRGAAWLERPDREREERPDVLIERLLVLGQPAGQDRDEDDVVDAQDDLERRERGEGDPGVGVGDPVEHGRARGGAREHRPPPAAAAPVDALIPGGGTGSGSGA